MLENGRKTCLASRWLADEPKEQARRKPALRCLSVKFLILSPAAIQYVPANSTGQDHSHSNPRRQDRNPANGVSITAYRWCHSYVPKMVIDRLAGAGSTRHKCYGTCPCRGRGYYAWGQLFSDVEYVFFSICFVIDIEAVASLSRFSPLRSGFS